MGSWYQHGQGDPAEVVKVNFSGKMHDGKPAGTAAAVLWDGFRMLETTQ